LGGCEEVDKKGNYVNLTDEQYWEAEGAAVYEPRVFIRVLLRKSGNHSGNSLRLLVRDINPSKHSIRKSPIFPDEKEYIYENLKPVFQFSQFFTLHFIRHGKGISQVMDQHKN
jgi:hypothetical protein